MRRKYLIILIVKVVAAALLFASQVLPARYMDISSYGLYAYILSLLTVLSAVTVWGADQFVIKKISSERHLSDSLSVDKQMFGVYLVAIINTLIVGFVLLSYLNYVFKGDLSLEVSVVVFLSLLVISLSKIGAASTKGFNRVISSEIVFNILRPCVFILGIVLIVSFWKLTIETIMGVLLFSFLVSFLVTSYLNYRMVGIRMVNSLQAIPYVYKLSFAFFLVGIGGPLLSNIDLILLGVMTSIEDVALYSVPSKVVNLVLLGLVSANLLIAPKLSPMFQEGNIEGIRQMIRDNNKVIAALTVVPIVTIVFYSEMILSLFGSAYINSTEILHILLVGQVINVFCGPVLLTCMMIGLQNKAAIVMICICIVEWALCVFFIPRYGPVGAAYANVISYTLMNLTLAYIIYKKVGVNVTMLNILKKQRG